MENIMSTVDTSTAEELNQGGSDFNSDFPRGYA